MRWRVILAKKPAFMLTEIVTYFALFLLINYIMFALVSNFSTNYKKSIKDIINKYQILAASKIITDDLIFANHEIVFENNKLTINYASKRSVRWELKNKKLYRHEDSANNLIISNLDKFEVIQEGDKDNKRIKIKLTQNKFDLSWAVKPIKKIYVK